MTPKQEIEMLNLLRDITVELKQIRLALAKGK